MFLLWLTVSNKDIFIVIENCLMIQFPVLPASVYPHFKRDSAEKRSVQWPRVSIGIASDSTANHYLGNKREQHKRTREKQILCMSVQVLCLYAQFLTTLEIISELLADCYIQMANELFCLPLLAFLL